MSAIEALPHGGARRPCRALQECDHVHIAYNILPATAIAPSARRGGKGVGSPTARAELLAGGLLPCGVYAAAPIADIAYQNKAAIYAILFKATAGTLLTIAADPKHLGAGSASPPCSIPGAPRLTHHPHVHCIVPGGGPSRSTRALDRMPAGLLPARGAVLSRLIPPVVPESSLPRRMRPAASTSFGAHARLPSATPSRPICGRCARIGLGRLSHASRGRLMLRFSPDAAARRVDHTRAPSVRE